MLLKNSIWLIYYALVGLGLSYLVFFNYSYWQSIQQRTNTELASINNVFAASVESTFTQQETLLELLGQQLLNKQFYLDSKSGTKLLDKILQQNMSFIGFGLANVDGEIILGSSNVKLDKMPNLRTSPKSKDSFNQALQGPELSIGRAYFIDVLNSIVIPVRKSIRDDNNTVLGVMTLGVKPKQLLFGLNELNQNSHQIEYSNILVQDDTFYRLYMATSDPKVDVNSIIGDRIDAETYKTHANAVLEQTGLTLNDIRHFRKTVEYHSVDYLGVESQFSVVYLPRFKLWSFVSRSRDMMFHELKEALLASVIVFFLLTIIFWVLFESLSKSAENNRNQLLNQANHDFLTGLNNRLFLQYVEPHWVADTHKEFSVLFIDLDDFKNINDYYGHNIGDIILKVVAKRLRDFFGNEHLVCRQGGDEFIVLYKENKGLSAESIANKVIEEIKKPYHINNYEFVIGASMGISKYPHDGEDFDALFSAADTAMYSAKRKKINYSCYTHELRVKTAHTANIDQALHYALQKNELFMVYQPQMKRNKEIYGVEALVRWNSDVLGFIPPDQFISVAENSGLILDIGHFILYQSISDMSRFSHRFKRNDIQLSVNISVRQFLENNFLSSLKTILDECQFNPKNLTLEITESIFIDDFDYILPLFKSIRVLGIKISLDDFGTGFSSLSMLKKLPIDELKIDKSFIDFIVDNETDRTMVVNILNIARSLKLKVVAEGIEDSDQADILDQHLCDVQQGYLYSKPIKFDDLIMFCNESGLP